MVALASLAIRSQQSTASNFARYRQLADETNLARDIEAAMLGTAISVVHYSYTKSDQALQGF